MNNDLPCAGMGIASNSHEAIELLIRLLDAYEGAEPNTADQRSAYRGLREAFQNLDFNPQLEPRTVVSRYLATLSIAAEGEFAQLISSISRRSVLTTDQLCTMLSSLADARAVISPATAFDLALRLRRMPETPLVDDAFAALPRVLGEQPAAVLSLLERMAEAPIVRPTAIYSGLQAIASNAPAYLGAAMAIQARLIEDPAIEVSQLSTILSDVSNRSGAYTLLLALAEHEPPNASKLVCAAFGQKESPFRIVSAPFRNEEDQVLQVEAKSRLLFLSDERLGRSVQSWLASVRKALRMQVAQTVYLDVLTGDHDKREVWVEFSSIGTRAQGIPRFLQSASHDEGLPIEATILLERTAGFFAMRQQ